MWTWIIIGLLLCIIIFLLLHKRKVGKEELKEYEQQIKQAEVALQERLDMTRQLDATLKSSQQIEAALEEKVRIKRSEAERKIQEADEAAEDYILELTRKINSRKHDYANVLAPMQNLEKERQEKLFYAIHLTNEDKSDIMYLLKEVAPNVKHKDIVSKLIWNEFLKNPLEETLTRVGVTASCGIYKLTNITNGMCYVGKSTNVRRRIQDHFKSVIGITSISDQKVHHEIMNAGIDNWMIEQVCLCDKDELGEKEKFYIDFFNAIEYGYNIKAGG